LINASSDRLKGVLDPAARTFAFSIDMSSFDGFNSPVQKEHFNENYIESKKHPKAIFPGVLLKRTILPKMELIH
jgi:hypothetical protein